MKTLRIFLMAAIALLAAACTTTNEGGSAPIDSSAFDSALAAARAEYAKAEEAGYAWRDTEKLMDAAEKAMKDGDADKAMKMVKQAMNQSSNALKQADDNKDAGPRY